MLVWTVRLRGGGHVGLDCEVVDMLGFCLNCVISSGRLRGRPTDDGDCPTGSVQCDDTQVLLRPMLHQIVPSSASPVSLTD